MRFRMIHLIVLALMAACTPEKQAAMAMEPADPARASSAEPAPSVEAAPSAPNRGESGDGASGAVDSTEALIRKKAPKGINEDYFVCIENAQGAIARAECMTSERDRQDSRLNKNYKELLKLLSPKSRPLLISAQREWLVFNEKDGEFENSLFPDEQISNLQLTEDGVFRICERANQLEYYLSLAKDD